MMTPLAARMPKSISESFPSARDRESGSASIARYYLRIAWLYRDIETYYAETDPDAHAASVRKVRKRWAKELPPHKRLSD